MSAELVYAISTLQMDELDAYCFGSCRKLSFGMIGIHPDIDPCVPCTETDCPNALCETIGKGTLHSGAMVRLRKLRPVGEAK